MMKVLEAMVSGSWSQDSRIPLAEIASFHLEGHAKSQHEYRANAVISFRASGDLEFEV